MKILWTILLLLILTACASTEGRQRSDPEVRYGGTFRTRAGSSHGM